MLLTLASLTLAAAPVAATPALVLRDVQILDLDSGAAREATIVVEDGKVAAIDRAPRIPAGARVVDARGLVALPGLFDMHVHLSWSRDSALPSLVANGVLVVRDLGGRLSELDAWRGGIDALARVGPRLLRAGPTLNGKQNAWHHVPVATRDEARAVVRTLKAVGVDFIKVHNAIERDPLEAVIDEARRLELKVVGHIPKAVTPDEAIGMGMAGIEHTETLFEGPFSKGKAPMDVLVAVEAWAETDAAAFGARLAAAKVPFTPCLAAYRSRFTPPPEAAMPYVAASLLAEPRRELSQGQRAGLARMLRAFQKIVGVFHRQGVTLLAGTDLAGAGGAPGESLHEELDLFVESGLSPLAALRAATIDSARFLGLDAKLGSVAPGKVADFVLVTGNPAEDIAALRTPQALVVRGRYLDRAAIDGLLSEARALASRR